MFKQTAASIRSQIYSFMDLEEGWHYGEGQSATQFAVDLALEVYSTLLENNIEEMEVFPSVDGGILVSGYYGEEVFDILCGKDGKLNFLHEKNDDIIVDHKVMSLSEVETYLRNLLWEQAQPILWKPAQSSDFFIQSISAASSEDLKASHFKDRLEEMSRSLMWSVQKGPAGAYVLILSDFTSRYQEHFQYSGESIAPIYHRMPNLDENRPLQETNAT